MSPALDSKKQVDMAVLDFSKAFDKVPHARLLKKIHHYGIHGNELGWIQSFLSDRTQAVVVDGAQSTFGSVTSGVPQGSVLGPALFLMFINDIALNVSSTVKLFADDCLIYRTIASAEDVGPYSELTDGLGIRLANVIQCHKCNVMRLTNARNNIIRGDYRMGRDYPGVNRRRHVPGCDVDKQRVVVQACHQHSCQSSQNAWLHVAKPWRLS